MIMMMIYRDTSDAPKQISNSGKIVLEGGPGNIKDVVLAQGFDLRQGFFEITVPFVLLGPDYHIIRKSLLLYPYLSKANSK